MSASEFLEDYEEETPQAKKNVQKEKETNKGYVSGNSSSFNDFLLKPEITRAIVESGFEHPSEVQYKCIPSAIMGVDILCQAKSGMGKTAVFVLSVLQQILVVPNQVSCLVLCHTRELAFQICNEFIRFSKHIPDVKVAAFYGGVKVEQNQQTLKNNTPNIVVGTPGRIKDLVETKHLDLSKIRFFILDECDKMLDQISMRSDVQQIFKKTPTDKQVMMFSATMHEEVKKCAKKFMSNATEILVDDEDKLTLHGLQQFYVKLSESEKNSKLQTLLDTLSFGQMVIFVSSKQRAQTLNQLLEDTGFPSICIYGDMPQEDRLRKYQQFKDYEKRIMVATDLIQRGIDIRKLNVVINYDMPDTSDAYLHRVGRAGRFGTKGLAISFVIKNSEKGKQSNLTEEEILTDIQNRFKAKMEVLPQKLDPSTYS